MAIPQAIKAEQKKSSDTNDCVVVAVAIATGKTYSEAQKALRLCGRKHRRGCSTRVMIRALVRLGFLAHPLKSWKGKTVTTLELPRKDNYIAVTCDHALAIKFGLVKDWTDGRRHRITQVWRIEAE